MLDIAQIRDNPDRLRKALASRGADVQVVDKLLELDESRRTLVGDVDRKRARRNEISDQIPRLAREKQPIDALKAESRTLGEELATLEDHLRVLQTELDHILLTIPNPPHASVPVGDAADKNVIAWSGGQPRAFDFAPKPHWELGEKLGVLDLERARKVSGSGFYVFKGPLARLERTLISWFLDTHTTRNGYTEVCAPHLVTRKTLTGTGQLPKFEEDLFNTSGNDKFLIPTAEVPITNLHADEIMDEAALPAMYCGYTPCYRNEAGGYGKETRGISRLFQFDKVEMVVIDKPEASYDTHERLTRHATWFLDQLGLAYRVMLLCTGDMGFGAAKCYDIELWAPGMNTWLEVSSCSNFEEFQARRANIRFRPAGGGKPRFTHTLNGSGLALPRLVIAIMENFQQADGSILIPEVLRERMGTDAIR